MAVVSISKALSMKTKLAGRLAHLANLLSANNSHLEGATMRFEAKELLKEYNASWKKLVTIKTAIAEANAKSGNFKEIYTIAEQKSLITHLRSLNTKEGKEIVGGRYGEKSQEVVHVAIFNAKEVDDMVSAAEAEIEAAQDKITYANQSTKIEIPD